MCGIAAAIDLNLQPRDLLPSLEAMSELIAHRGPDGHGLWERERGGVALAHRRLTIIDLSSTGSQPMTDGDGNWLTYNGEIYNYVEVRQVLGEDGFRGTSDTEVLLRAYRRWGVDCLDQLRGMFAFALWDEQEGQLFCARDRFGIKPLYYAQVDGVLYLASEAKALLPFLAAIETDDEGLQDYLTFQFSLLLPLALTGIGLVAVAALPGLSRARKLRLLLQTIYTWIGVTLFVLLVTVLDHPDAWGLAVLSLLVGGFVFSIVAGRLAVAPAGFGAAPGAGPPKSEPAPGADAPVPLPPSPPRAPAAPPSGDAPFLRVVAPGELPSFADVGGMHELKQELLDTLGLTLAFAGEAEAYRISWNGILLHGPPGVGKTFLARALAGELGLSFIPVATGDLVSSYRGASAQNVRRAFALAATRVPCLLFFDEFDSVAQRRDDTPDEETRRTVNQLLQSLEEYRVVRELVVMAATNDLDDLDEAAVRPGRFDRHVHVGLPDAEARAAIIAAQLRDRPVDADVDEQALAARTEGFTAAAIANVVELAALAALREATRQGAVVHIDDRHLRDALEQRGGRDRPGVEDSSWEELILDDATKGELQELQRLIEDPERARRLGVDPPGGVLLTGPPGTGKTTIARVLAAQSRCSFYPVSAADLTSKWLGESERAVKRLFERARQNAPSIIFIDEIDAIASRRGDWGSYDRQINELLQAMDGIAGRPGVFVLAATNRPDKLDPALLRGGRLGRTLEVQLPDEAARLELLRLFSRDMPVRGVDLPALAARTAGYSGADLRALCQQAALNALAAAPAASPADAVGAAHFDEALTEIRPGVRTAAE